MNRPDRMSSFARNRTGQEVGRRRPAPLSVESLKARLLAAETRVRQLQDALDGVSAERCEMAETITSQQNAIIDRDRKNMILQAQIDALGPDQRSKLEETIAELRGEKVALQAENAELSAELRERVEGVVAGQVEEVSVLERSSGRPKPRAVTPMAAKARAHGRSKSGRNPR